jgi:hypothetical protein
MNAESPLAFGIAGQERRDTGSPFTAVTGTGSAFVGRDWLGAPARRAPGPHPDRRVADGDGR